MIQAGTKLGRYEIRSKLGAGGMGEVYLAEDTELHRKVASQPISNSDGVLDSGLRQKVDLYDSQMKFIGSDLKYAHPVISNYVFANNKVYVPDLGFGRAFPTRGISPLDVPSKALSLKVFEDWFQRSFEPTANS
jgi:hypothetical protein